MLIFASVWGKEITVLQTVTTVCNVSLVMLQRIATPTPLFPSGSVVHFTVFQLIVLTLRPAALHAFDSVSPLSWRRSQLQQTEEVTDSRGAIKL